MQIKHVSSLLPNGLIAPQLNALQPNEDNYRALLFQPRGQIEVCYDEAGRPACVRNRNAALMCLQFKGFVKQAVSTGADLAVTPEYSMPWAVLVEAINANSFPELGKVWVLGCESIKYEELVNLKSNLAGDATVLFEALAPDPHRFVDPLVYLFRSEGVDGKTYKIVLVQFKTCPMGDPRHFEINGLQRGSLVYEFGDLRRGIRLVSLICSDAFDFESEGHAHSVYDRTLLLHLQLNHNPRHPNFRKYRDTLFNLSGDATEVVCLNWSEGIELFEDGRAKQWDNIAGSPFLALPAPRAVRQLQTIREQQWDVAWRSYVHTKFRDQTGPAATRQRDLVLDLSQSSEPVPPSKIPELTPRLAKAYATKSSKTLQRDLVELEYALELIKRTPQGVLANREIILAFLPWRKPNPATAK